MRPTTKIVGWTIIAFVALVTTAVSLISVAFLGYTVDLALSKDQPTVEEVFTVEKLLGEQAYTDGGASFILQTRNQSGRVTSMTVSFEAGAGDRVKWRFRRTRWLKMMMPPVEVLKCNRTDPC